MADFIRSRRPNTSRMWLNLGLAVGAPLLIAGVVTALALNGFGRPQDQPNGEAGGTDAGGKAGPVVEFFTSLRLQKAYRDNEPAAKTKYMGKTVGVMGVVRRVREDANSGQWVIEFAGVECWFIPNAEPGLLKLKPGWNITVCGTCTGRQNEVVKVVDCQFAPPLTGKADEQAKKHTVQQITLEYCTNPEATIIKYSGVVIELTGSGELNDNWNLGPAVLLDKKENSLEIICRLSQAEARRLIPTRSEKFVVRGRFANADIGYIYLQDCIIISK